METPILTDKLIVPTDEILKSTYANGIKIYQELKTQLQKKFPDIILEWKFYPDGKRWLMPAVYKKKPLFWMGAFQHGLKVSFWFGKKAEPFIENSSLSESIKELYRTAQQNKLGRGISILLENNETIETILQIIEVKSKIK